MPFCPMCAAPHDDNARFCVRCGAGTTFAPPTQTYGASALSAAPRAQFDGQAVTEAVQSFVGEFQKLPFKTLVPLRAWWEERVWQQWWAALFLVAAITPFLLLHLGGDPQNFHKVAWGFSVYFAFIWFITLFVLIRPGELDWPLLGKVALFTIVLGVALAISLEKHLASGQMNVVKYIVGVGVPEELAKALAVYLFVFRAAQARSLRTYLFVGAVSGLAFGAAEAVSYSGQFEQVLPFVSNASTAVIVEIWRLLTDSLFHACMAGITGFFIGLAAQYRSFSVGLIGFGLAFAAVMHGLYDNFANGWFGAVLAIAIVLVFVGYVATCDHIGARFHEHATGMATPIPAPVRPGATWEQRTWTPPTQAQPASAVDPSAGTSAVT